MYLKNDVMAVQHMHTKFPIIFSFHSGNWWLFQSYINCFIQAIHNKHEMKWVTDLVHVFYFNRLHWVTSRLGLYHIQITISNCAFDIYSFRSSAGLGSSTFRSTWVKYKYFFIFASTSTSSSTQSTWKTSSTSSTFSIKYESSTSTLVTNNSISHSTTDGLCY